MNAELMKGLTITGTAMGAKSVAVDRYRGADLTYHPDGTLSLRPNVQGGTTKSTDGSRTQLTERGSFKPTGRHILIAIMRVLRSALDGSKGNLVVVQVHNRKGSPLLKVKFRTEDGGKTHHLWVSLRTGSKDKNPIDTRLTRTPIKLGESFDLIVEVDNGKLRVGVRYSNQWPQSARHPLIGYEDAELVFCVGPYNQITRGDDYSEIMLDGLHINHALK